MKALVHRAWHAPALFVLAVTGWLHGQEQIAPKSSALALTSNSYLRVVRPDTNTVQLQVAVRKFAPAGKSGPAIWLVGAAHIGETNYYQALQKHLDAQPLVLFEGVSERPKKSQAGKTPSAESKAASPESPSTSLQTTLAESLGLVFQLNGIDYDRPHFRKSDLSVKQLQQLMEADANAADKSGAEFNQLLQLMDGSSFLGGLVRFGLGIVASSPKLQAVTKLTLVETMGQLRGDLTQMRGLPSEMRDLLRVLIEARNRKVIADLKAELKKAAPPASIAVFYGAAHMHDFEQRLRSELRYEPGEELWLTAISVNLRQAGLTNADVEMVRSMVEWQMKQLQPEK
jgi:hypothetical protein